MAPLVDNLHMAPVVAGSSKVDSEGNSIGFSYSTLQPDGSKMLVTIGGLPPTPATEFAISPPQTPLPSPPASRARPATVEDDDEFPTPARPHVLFQEPDPVTPVATSPKRRVGSHPIRPAGIHDSEPGGPRSRAHAKIHSYADGAARHASGAFPRISRHVELLRSSYDVVVIGSGYGGGIAASRMARAGESVCLLERGQERWPGEYPTGARDALSQLHFSGEFSPHHFPGKTADGGNPTGMYHLIFGRGQNTIVGNGLGGTSLINANVFLPADQDTLSLNEWPPELQAKGALDKYYKRVEDVLEPEEYPADWPVLPKAKLLEKQAEILRKEPGLENSRFYRVRQTTRFRNGPNSCGVEMSPSALSGQDATGLNDGSKTTTLVTYLADAWNWGAEMFCQCEVRHIEKVTDARGGYIIYFAWHGRNRGHFKSNLHGDLMWVHAKRAVFLGAGSIGTTEILLRSRAMGLPMSDEVGQKMSGNGDILAFGYNTNDEVNSVGRKHPDPYNPVGPCITSVIDNRDGHDNPLDGYVIEEGTVPRALAHMFQAMLDFMPGRQCPDDDTVVDRTQAALARWGSRLLGPYFRKGAVGRTQVYLIMSHDSNQAVLSLKDDRPVLEFLGVGRSQHVKELNSILAKATKAVGGTLVQNPFFALMGQQQVTVHPIGGANMAQDNTGATGVTNHRGEVFSGNGSETHKGLIVADGALVPIALGVNPFATIAALAERCIDEYAKENHLLISTEKNGILDLFGQPAHQPRAVPHGPELFKFQQKQSGQHLPRTLTLDERKEVEKAANAINKAQAMRAGGFGFTEVMCGYVHGDPKMKEDCRETYELACRTAKSRCESARFFLSVQAFNTKDMLYAPDGRGMLTGTFVSPAIPGSPFMVQRGSFGLFTMDRKAPGTRNLTYDFDMVGVDGNTLHFHGYKVVDSSVALSPKKFWRATSTLYVTITKKDHPSHIDRAEHEAWRHCTVVGKGIMHIQPQDFRAEVKTMKPTGLSVFRRAKSAAYFMTFFARKSLSLFLAPLTPLQYPSQSYSGYINNTPPTESFAIQASDGVYTRMHMWEATSTPKDRHGRPTPPRNLFMVPGAAVDHQIFALPTIPFNTVNYFTRAGYRVFVSVHRIGQIMAAHNLWTTFDARLDLRACLEYIRENYSETEAPEPPSKIYTIAHCMGSVAFSSGMLDGTIPGSWISGVTCSQVFMNPIWGPANMAKVMAGPVPLDKLYGAAAGSWFSCSTSRDDTRVQRALNQALRLYPDRRKELCNNASCHRCTLVFGRCWNHGNLNEATHRQIDRFFGGVNMRLLNLLMKMGTDGHAMENDYTQLTTEENINRLRGISFLLFVGKENAVLSTESTLRTLETLQDHFGADSLRSSPVPSATSSSVPGDMLGADLKGKSGLSRASSAGSLSSSTSSSTDTATPATPVDGQLRPLFTVGLGINGKQKAREDISAVLPCKIRYQRKEIPGYGHLDSFMGKNAWKDVYPMIRKEVDRVVRGESYKFVEPEDRFKQMMDNGDLLH
ncbi:cholesterol oxidase [Gaeumannomyces tritici R3-111a-1]|uniref:Cholesterol oxidase n=1 Tax=Gaeumannomyces tritici (strain R3-111a-1) TaxID=644352 RepID=J3P024_GAET3|nr:cholesterol oxidase [Gaeumannomyces tritici R3-111a-1]EJT76957.1 cholesterol oxidase [Gaeumannomyces tritici R3-111a-1]